MTIKEQWNALMEHLGLSAEEKPAIEVQLSEKSDEASEIEEKNEDAQELEEARSSVKPTKTLSKEDPAFNDNRYSHNELAYSEDVRNLTHHFRS